MRNGIEIALEEVGRESVTVVFEDDQFAPAKAVAAYKKLVDGSKVDVVIVAASSPSNAVAPVAQRAGVPLIAWASDSMVAQGRSLVLRSYVSGQSEGARMAEEATRRGYRHVGWISSTNDYTASVRAGVVPSLPPGTVAYDEEVPADLTDFKPFLLRMRRAGVDAIGMCVQPGQGGLLAKQAHALGMKLPFFGCYYLADSQEIAVSEGALSGAWLVSDSTTVEFRKRYIERFHNDSVLSGAALHYDVIRLLAKAQQSCARGQALIDELFRIGKVVDGAVGSYPLVRKDGDQFMALPLVIKEMTKGGIIEVP